MAKVVSKRLKMVLGDIIHTTQTGFQENRSIFDNVITFWEYSAWAEEQEVDLAVMLLDFGKAYDRISLDFLEAVMTTLGFEHQWILGMVAFYRGSPNQVLIGGSMGRALRCYVRYVKDAHWPRTYTSLQQKLCIIKLLIDLGKYKALPYPMIKVWCLIRHMMMTQ